MQALDIKINLFQKCFPGVFSKICKTYFWELLDISERYSLQQYVQSRQKETVLSCIQDPRFKIQELSPYLQRKSKNSNRSYYELPLKNLIEGGLTFFDKFIRINDIWFKMKITLKRLSFTVLCITGIIVFLKNEDINTISFIIM